MRFRLSLLRHAQGQWLVFGGQIEANGLRYWHNDLYSFDFASLSWGKPELAGEPLTPRGAFMAVCYEESVVIMAGDLLHIFGL